MLKTRTLPVGQLATNCYLVISDKQALIIDPGDDADFIMRIISDEDVTPRKIVATHAHYDHILAVTELKLAYKIPFLMHRKDEFLLKEMKKSAKYFSGISTDPIPKVDKYIKGGDTLTINNQKLNIIDTPGHTPGSVTLYDDSSRSLFVGDLIFALGGVGRTDFRYSKAFDLKESIKKILKLPSETKVYPGHGEETTIGESRKYLIKYG